MPSMPTTNPAITVPLVEGQTIAVSALEMFHLLKLREKLAAYELALIWAVKPDDMDAFNQVAQRDYTFADIARYAGSFAGCLELCAMLLCDANPGLTTREALALIEKHRLAARIMAASQRLPLPEADEQAPAVGAGVGNGGPEGKPQAQASTA